MSRTRRNFTSEQKADVVRRHVKDKVPVSDLAAELSIQPSQVHQWIEAVLGQAEKAFANKPGKRAKNTQAALEKAKQKQLKRLQDKLHVKNEVIAELMEENIKAKKEFGDL